MTSPGPLAGLKVFELAHIMAGPVCGRMLADLGADVIKVEPVQGGDPSRSFGPDAGPAESGPFSMLNRNKRGMAIDLKQPGGRDALKRLLSRADVVIENFRTGTMERLGLGYDVLKEDNPRLIYCGIAGFGRNGPLAEHGGFDLIAQGYAGLMSITGESEGRPPVKVGAPLTDITAGILGALGIVSAVVQRERTGQGTRVDTSLFEAGIIHTLWHSALALAGLPVPGALGTAHPLTAPYQAFQTADGWVNVGASNDATWLRLLTVLDREDLGQDDRFRTMALRHANRVALEKQLATAFAERGTAEWVERLNNGGVPAGPVLDIEQMLAHPQAVARDMVVSVETAAGLETTLGSPVKVGGSPGPISRSAPTLGQDTADVLAEYGFADDEVEKLRSSGVITTPG